MELETVGKLTGAQFWKWKTFIVSMQLAESKSKASTLQLELLKKDLEILRLKIANFSQVCSTAEAHSKGAKDDYEAVKKEIEQELGILLADVVIDEVTFEIKKQLGDLTNGSSTSTQA